MKATHETVDIVIAAGAPPGMKRKFRLRGPG